MVDQRHEIFAELRTLLKKYEPPLTALADSQGRYELTSVKDIVIAGRRKKDIYFAAAIVQKSYVGFYFMPVYADLSVTKQMPPELMKTLKGKACFHIKQLDPSLKKQVAEALKIGFNFYKKQGWV